MKQHYIALLRISTILLIPILFPCGAIAQTMDIINVSADTYVRDGSQANDNYGSEAEVLARDTTTSAARIVYFKFPVDAGLPSSVSSATLKFFTRINSSSTSTEFLEVHKMGSNWQESTVTWNTKPDTGAFITNNLAVPVGPTNPAPYSEISQDVTAYFNQILGSGETEISFAIKALPSSAGGDDRAVRIGTKEDSNPTAATLELNYTLGIDDLNFNQNVLKVYPNPVRSEFTINKFFQSPDTLGITMYNLLGQKVLSITERVGSGEWNKVIDKNQMNFNSGVYVLKLSTEKHGESSSKIVIN